MIYDLYSGKIEIIPKEISYLEDFSIENLYKKIKEIYTQCNFKDNMKLFYNKIYKNNEITTTSDGTKNKVERNKEELDKYINKFNTYYCLILEKDIGKDIYNELRELKESGNEEKLSVKLKEYGMTLGDDNTIEIDEKINIMELDEKKQLYQITGKLLKIKQKID